MTAPVSVVAAAADALARFDDGLPAQPDDLALIAAYEQQCQQESDRLWESMWRAEYEADLAKWLETQCPECVTGGEGEVCEEHIADGRDGEANDPDPDGCPLHDLIVCGPLMGGQQ